MNTRRVLARQARSLMTSHARNKSSRHEASDAVVDWRRQPAPDDPATTARTSQQDDPGQTCQPVEKGDDRRSLHAGQSAPEVKTWPVSAVPVFGGGSLEARGRTGQQYKLILGTIVDSPSPSSGGRRGPGATHLCQIAARDCVPGRISTRNSVSTELLCMS